MATVKWLPEALVDIERLHSFLFDKNPKAAAEAAAIILRSATLLESSPRIGRPMSDETDRRELFAAYGAGAYVIRYKLVGTSPVIFRVWHSKEYREAAI